MDNLYLLYDVKSDLYSAPFLGDTDGAVRRMILDMALHGGDNLVSQHPEDFEVYNCGNFDKRTGLYDIKSSYIFVARVSELVENYKLSLRNKVVSINDTAPSSDESVCIDTDS